MITTWQRDTFSVTVNVKDDNGVLVNLAGATAQAWVKPKLGNQVDVPATQVSIVDAPNGKLLAVFSSGSLNFGGSRSLDCDLQVVVTKSGEIQTVVDRSIIVKKSLGL